MHNVIILIKSVLNEEKVTTNLKHLKEYTVIKKPKNNKKKRFYGITVLIFGEKKVTKENFYTVKKPMKIWAVNNII